MSIEKPEVRFQISDFS